MGARTCEGLELFRVFMGSVGVRECGRVRVLGSEPTRVERVVLGFRVLWLQGEVMRSQDMSGALGCYSIPARPRNDGTVPEPNVGLG